MHYNEFIPSNENVMEKYFHAKIPSNLKKNTVFQYKFTEQPITWILTNMDKFEFDDRPGLVIKKKLDFFK